MMFISVLFLLLAAIFAVAWWLERGRNQRLETERLGQLAEQRLQRENELREQAQRTAALFERMIEGLIVVDAGGRIRLANRAAGELFNFTPPAIGRTILETTRHHEVAALVTRLENEPEILGHELRLETLESPKFLQVNALALRDGDGARDGAILVIHDLTRLRQLEAVRQEFVANVSHELRTPLSLIKSAAETLIDGGKDEPDSLIRFLQIIDKHANRLTLLIDDLLMLSTLDSGNIRLALQSVSLGGAVQEVADDLRGRAHARGVTIKNQVGPALIVQADPDRLRQVISNLIDNAIKYGRIEGAVVISARSLDSRRIEVSVQDDGPGIPAEACARIFERFFRGDKARSREQGGTGLGLAIVKHVVQAHGGEVRVESAPGAGARFSFTLPVA
ncbi:MAG: PAS domain-containing protein [Opitutaceae bacterium]|jgi:two-component system phosphate regulon sensor histidine kinase PhoR|nr:PAS domain-containing protein [Opitutaceae bacterium]